jgi:hypothetical protein
MKKRVLEKDKKVFHKRGIRINWWFDKYKGKSFIQKMRSETWYGSFESFTIGYFILIQLGFASFHFRFTWWQHKTFGDIADENIKYKKQLKL